jgi:hypothetical protein
METYRIIGVVLIIGSLFLTACQPKPAVIISPDAQLKMDAFAITIDDGKVFRNGTLIGRFILTDEELRELNRTQTQRLEFFVEEEELQMRVTDEDGVVEYFRWNGERFRPVDHEQ